MSKLITFGSKEPLEVSNKDIRGLNLSCQLVHNTNNTDFVDADLDLSKITVEVVLQRAGKTFTIATGNVRDLVSFSNYKNELFLGARAFTGILRTTLAKDTSVKTTCVVPLNIDFGGIINLRGSDKLTVNVEAQSGAINSTNVNSSTSKVYFEFKEGIGLEYGTPYLKVQYIPVNQSLFSVPAGDNVTKAVLLNFDLAVTNYLSSTRPVSSVVMKSDKLNSSRTFDELLADQFVALLDADDAPIRGQNYLLHDGVELDKCTIEVNLVSANVTADKNCVVWSSFYVDERLIVLAAQREAKHAERDVQKVFKK